MEKSELNRLFQVTKLVLTVDFIDRGLQASRRSLPSVKLEKSSITCVHIECEGAEIRYTQKMRQLISELKEKGERMGAFTIQCQGSKKGSQGHLTCGGFYQFNVEIDYETEGRSV